MMSLDDIIMLQSIIRASTEANRFDGETGFEIGMLIVGVFNSFSEYFDSMEREVRFNAVFAMVNIIAELVNSDEKTSTYILGALASYTENIKVMTKKCTGMDLPMPDFGDSFSN